MAGGWTQVTYKTQASDGGIFSTDAWTTNYDYLYVEAFIKQDGTQTVGMQFNSDTNGNSNSNYSYRYSGDFSDGADGGANGNWKIMGNYSSFEGGMYIKAFIKNTEGKQKFLTGETLESRTTSQVTSNSNCPTQSWWYGSYNVTSGQINKINIVRESSSHGNILQGSWIMVSGSNALNTTDEKTTISNVEVGTRFYETDTRKIYRAKSVGFANGTSGSGSDWTEVAFDSSTSANNGTASGNVVTRSSYPSSGDWTSYIRSSTHYLDPSEGGGEVYFTVSNNTHVSMGLEKSPYNSHPSGVYQSRDYSFHTTTATNNMYESTSSYDGTDWNNATNEWRITMDSAGLVKYYYRANSSSSWNLERTSTVTASGKYYVSVSVYSTASCTCYIKSDATIAWKERGSA